MSPQEALRSPVALFYLGLTFGLLLGAGPLLWALRCRADQAWQAYRGWLVIVPLTAAALFLGLETAVLFFTGVTLLCFTEFARATRLAEDWCLTGVACLGILAAGAAPLLPD